jgi:5-methyltetrahydrofolate--homocysteine methyltransferase
MDYLTDISTYLQEGNGDKVAALTHKAVGEKLPPKKILDEGLIRGMNVISEKYKEHEIFLPDVLLAAKAMYAGMDILKPLFIKEGITAIGRVVLGTVHGDLHDIGKNLVGIMLKGAGLEVIDLGNDVTPERFVEAAQKEDASVIGMSALLTTTMPVMKMVVDHLKKDGLNGRIKTIVGGAPVSDEFAKQIGADAYAYDSAHAVDCVKKLIAETKK